MAIQNWSDDILVVDLSDDPQFSEDLGGLSETLEGKPRHVVLNFSAVSFINSSNIARLLRMRKQVAAAGRKLVLSDVNTQVWGVFLITGLDKIFEFINDISTALATLQLTGGKPAKDKK